jgi:hypothetical protein
MDDFLNRLVIALDGGKRRGYDVIRDVDGVSYLFEFALKKHSGVYETYFFSIEELEIDQPDEDGEEEIRQFLDLNSALENLKSHGAELEKLTAIKRALPF